MRAEGVKFRAGVDVGAEVAAGVSFGGVLAEGGTEHHRAQAFFDAGLNHKAGFAEADEGVPAGAAGVAGDEVGELAAGAGVLGLGAHVLGEVLVGGEFGDHGLGLREGGTGDAADKAGEMGEVQVGEVVGEVGGLARGGEPRLHLGPDGIEIGLGEAAALGEAGVGGGLAAEAGHEGLECHGAILLHLERGTGVRSRTRSRCRG